MGICIYCDIAPKRVTKEKWSEIYYETEKLINAFPFMDSAMKARNGYKYCCAVRAVGKDNLCGRNSRGWRTFGDLQTMKTAEDYCLYENLDIYLARAGQEDDGLDMLRAAVRAYCGLKYPEPSAIAMLFDAKTQGEYYHIPLLAVACLIESRMPEGAAIVYGDINLAQCKAAVKWANHYLDEPISLPVRCDRNRLLARLEKSDIARADIPKTLVRLTMQAKDAELGKLLSFHYSDETYAYYRSEFSDCDLGAIGFPRRINEYLEMGLDFKSLARMLVVDPAGKQMPPEEFVKRIIKSKLYVKDKVTYDYTDTDADRPGKVSVDGISDAMSRVLWRFAGLQNKNVDAYMPLEEIRSACREVFGNMADADAQIDAAIEETGKEEDASQDFYDNKLDGITEAVNKKNQEDSENYDICKMDDLQKWHEGCSILPSLEEALKNLCIQLHGFADKEWDDFAALDRVERENYFLKRDEYHVWLTESDWVWIFDNIMDDDEIKQAYALFCVDTSRQNSYDIVRRFWLCPDVYEYYWTLTEGMEAPEAEKSESES